jgi:hypothetical protein
MKKLLVEFLMFGLIFGTAATTKAADFGIHFGKNHGYDYRTREFSSWDASQRDRISDEYRDRMISQTEYDRLNRELDKVEAYHDRISSKGLISRRETDRLDRMEARVNSDIPTEINEHTD